MRLIWMRPSGRPVWPRSLAAKRRASVRTERSTALERARVVVTVAPPWVPAGSTTAPPSWRRASACQVRKVSLSWERIWCCS